MNQFSQHHVVPRGDQAVTVHGVFSNDRFVGGGHTGEPEAEECTLVFTLRVGRSLLDVGVARLGFMGSHNGDIFTMDVPAISQYRDGLWDLPFPIRTSGPDGEDLHAYQGAFYVETIHGAYHWLKYLGESDFHFDYHSLPTLASLTAPLS